MQDKALKVAAAARWVTVIIEAMEVHNQIALFELGMIVLEISSNLDTRVEELALLFISTFMRPRFPLKYLTMTQLFALLSNNSSCFDKV